MTELEQLWRRKTDYELRAAARRLHEYSEASQQAIKVEVERRKSPEYLRSLEPVAKARTVEQPQLRSEAPPTYTNSPAWLAQRALLAAGLMIGFYLFAVTIAVALLSIPFAEWNYLNRLDFRIAAVCVGSGLTILWWLLPRRDHFTPPGPRLEESSCVRLFSMVRRIADATSQEPPSDVYLLNDVNAFVAHRAGVIGFGLVDRERGPLSLWRDSRRRGSEPARADHHPGIRKISGSVRPDYLDRLVSSTPMMVVSRPSRLKVGGLRRVRGEGEEIRMNPMNREAPITTRQVGSRPATTFPVATTSPVPYLAR